VSPRPAEGLGRNRRRRRCARRAGALAATLAAALIAPSLDGKAAWASAPDICQPDPACQVHSKQGVQLSVAREYAAALDEFRAAYAIHPEPRLLINIGRCLYRLNRAKEAQEQLRRFLQSEPDPDHEDQEKVNQYLADVHTALAAEQAHASARVSIQGAPDGAHVLVDGAERAVAPLPGPLELAPGPHELEIRGAQSYRRHLDLGPGQDVAVVMAATTEPGRGPRPTWRLVLGATGLGLGAAAIGSGAYLLALSGQCAAGAAPPACGTGFDAQGRLLVQVYDTSGAGAALVAVGAAAAVAGIVLLAVPGPRPRVAAAWRGGAGLAAAGAF
jgi:hypothetical protein